MLQSYRGKKGFWHATSLAFSLRKIENQISSRQAEQELKSAFDDLYNAVKKDHPEIGKNVRKLQKVVDSNSARLDHRSKPSLLNSLKHSLGVK